MLRSLVFTLMNACGFPGRHHYMERVVFVAHVAPARLYPSVSIERQVASFLNFLEMNGRTRVKAICSRIK